MEKIIVAYWHLTKFKDLDYEHTQEFIYTVEKRNEIIDDVLAKGYSIMLQPLSDALAIWIDNDKFRTR